MILSRRDLVALGGAGVAAALLPRRLGAQVPAAAGSPAEADAQLRLVDPELRGPFLANRTVVNALTLPQVRERMAAHIPPWLTRPPIVRPAIPGPKGAPDVAIAIINAGTTGAPRPALLYLHGGGYVAGGVAGELAMAQRIARDHECVVVSVDYRLAPETRFPGALEDNYAALKWVVANAAELGVDTRRIAVMGTSAGGGHAAMRRPRPRIGEVPICFQLLLSPMLDDRTGSSRPMPPAHRRLHLDRRRQPLRLVVVSRRARGFERCSRRRGAIAPAGPRRAPANLYRRRIDRPFREREYRICRATRYRRRARRTQRRARRLPCLFRDQARRRGIEAFRGVVQPGLGARFRCALVMA